MSTIIYLRYFFTLCYSKKESSFCYFPYLHIIIFFVWVVFFFFLFYFSDDKIVIVKKTVQQKAVIPQIPVSLRKLADILQFDFRADDSPIRKRRADRMVRHKLFPYFLPVISWKNIPHRKLRDRDVFFRLREMNYGG